MSGSALSPAKNIAFKEVKSYPLTRFPSGSSRLIALKAVGAVKKVFTLYSSIIRQKVPASGVPTGFPSKRTVVFPFNKGAYTI